MMIKPKNKGNLVCGCGCEFDAEYFRFETTRNGKPDNDNTKCPACGATHYYPKVNDK